MSQNDTLFQSILSLPQETKERAAIHGIEMYIKAKALYDKVCSMTTPEFGRGEEKLEREALAAVLTDIDGKKR